MKVDVILSLDKKLKVSVDNWQTKYIPKNIQIHLINGQYFPGKLVQGGTHLVAAYIHNLVL